MDQSKWYHEAIDFVVSQNLMRGMSDTLFQPDGNMTRAQMVTVLYRLADTPAVEGSVPFTDVKAGQFYSDALVWAYENGIAKGVTDQRFAPHASVTREQMVVFFARFAQLNGQTVEAKGDLSNYHDASAISNYAKESMAWAVGDWPHPGHHLNHPEPQNHFHPRTDCRGSAALLHHIRFISNLKHLQSPNRVGV